MAHLEALIIGGGQSGLATAYHLINAGVDTLVLDNGVAPGGAWNHYPPTLRLLSPAELSSLPGMAMPPITGDLRPAHIVEYLANYEGLFDVPVERPVRVEEITHDGTVFHVAADRGDWSAEHVVMATGTWSTPFVADYPGTILGQFWHSANYPGPETFRDTDVAVIGAGNSGAQLVAELSEIADVTWLTRHEPRYLPEEIDGAELHRRLTAGEDLSALGDVVRTPQIARARAEGRMTTTRPPASLGDLTVNHFIWATGYKPALGPARGLLDDELRPTVDGLHLVGYGAITGVGSDTLAGVGRHAQQTARTITRAVDKRQRR